jgi:hypothetical protein
MMYLNVNLLIKHYGDLTPSRKQLPFYFKCVFWGISPSRRTLRHYAGGASPILYVPMFSWKYFFFMKEENFEEIKRELHKGRFQYSCILLRFGNTLHCPSLRRTHREPPLQPPEPFFSPAHVSPFRFLTTNPFSTTSTSLDFPREIWHSPC